MRLRVSRILTALMLAVALLAVSGCGGEKTAASELPASASLAPKDAIAFLTIVSDEGSEQWQRGDRLLGMFPGARASFVAEIENDLADEGLSWSKDVAPALGSELVVVVTAGKKPVVLTQPDDADALQTLARKADEPVVTGEVSGWTAIAETQAVLDAYRAGVEQGSLADVDSFRTAFGTLQADAIARGWVDVRAAVKGLSEAFEGSDGITDIEVQDLTAAVSTEEDGVLLSVGIKAPKGTGSTSYEPKLLERVPADAVVALSFGGTQGVLDRVERTIDLEGIAGAVNDTIGVSLESVLDALSGEGVLYVREGAGEIPEVTLVLDPPNADKTWSTIEDIAGKLANEADARITTGTQAGVTVNRIEIEDIKVTYARIDAETMIVTSGADSLDRFLEDGSKLTDDPDFNAASERVELGERTNGFAYVDLDGLIPFIEGLGGPDALPADAREALEAMDSFILQTSADGDSARLSGFLRIPG
jgi:Protein of unknown function (DUF3352)